jgi:orotate phosphoribosyltransferase
MNTGTHIAQLLIEKQAVKINFEERFTWTSGIQSPIYCDNRLLIGHTDARKVIVDAFVTQIKSLYPEVQYVAGTATAGIPWAAFVAWELNIPMVYVRSKPKGHGAGRMVEGFMEAKKNVIVVEDLISTGGSSIKSAHALKNEFDSNVLGVMSIFEYGFTSAKEAFLAENLTYHSLSNISYITKHLELPETEQTELKIFLEKRA